MIVFDLDGTLADCEHRRHFVDPRKNDNYKYFSASFPSSGTIKDLQISDGYWSTEWNGEKFKPDYQAFYQACNQDKPILPTIHIFKQLRQKFEVEIWSGRCESVREKTIDWLEKVEPYLGWVSKIPLKMRPIGDSTPDDKLKERWLLERCADHIEAQIQGKMPSKHDISFVFDDRPKVIRMWRSYGIFVFNCCQHYEEF